MFNIWLYLYCYFHYYNFILFYFINHKSYKLVSILNVYIYNYMSKMYKMAFLCYFYTLSIKELNGSYLGCRV